MKLAKPTLLLLLVGTCMVCLCGAAESSDPLETAGAWRWRRQLEFARMLANRRWFDIAEEVIAGLESDQSVIGRQKAAMHRDLGEFFAEIAPDAVRGSGGMDRFIDFVNRGRGYYEKCIDYLEKRKRYPAEVSRLRSRIVWLTLSIAEAHARFVSDPATAEKDKKTHLAEATKLYKSAIDTFVKAIADKKRAVDTVRKRKPSQQDEKRYKAWDREYKDVRADYFRTRLFLNEARVRFARFIRKAQKGSKEWMGELKNAESDLKKLLLEFSGTPGAKQANVNLGIVLYEQGTSRDKEAIERLEEIWRSARTFSARKVPCDAGHWLAKVYLRQKNTKKAIEQLNDVLKFRSGDAWKPEEGISQENVAAFLADNADADAEDYDQKALANTFLLLAECYATQADKGKQTKADPRAVRRDYGTAYRIASGVGEVRGSVPPEYIEKVEQWRRAARLPRSVADLQRAATQKLMEARNAKDPERRAQSYREAAKLYAEVLARGDVPPDQKQDGWFLVGQCYYFSGDYYEAYTVFTALTRWYERPVAKRREAASFALAAAQQRYKETNDPFDKSVVDRAAEWRERVETGGKGGRVAVVRGVDLRKQGKFEYALEKFRSVPADDEAYPRALYEIGLTYKAMYQRMPAAGKPGAQGMKARQAIARAFEGVLQEYRARAPKLAAKDDEDSREALQYLIDIAAGALLQICNSHMSGYHPQPDLNVIIKLTDNVVADFPGIEDSAYAPVLYFMRIRAAYKLIEDTKTPEVAEVERLAKVVDGSWDLLKKYPDFQYLVHACGASAGFNNKVAAKLGELAKATQEAARKKALTERAEKAENRALELYVELLTIAPKQPLSTYAYVIAKLKARDNTTDYRRVVDFAKEALRRHDGGLSAKDAELRQRIQVYLGVALCKTEAWNEAARDLEEVEADYEKVYQARMKGWEAAKKAHESEPRRHRPPGPQPRRRAEHREAREWLARSIVESKATTKYAKAVDIYVELGRDYRRNGEKYLDVLYWLCEIYRRQGQFQDALGRLDRAVFTWVSLMRTPEFAPRFRELLTRIRQDVGRASVANKDAYLKIIDDILTKLK